MSILKYVNDANNNYDSFEYIVKYVTTKPYTNFTNDVAAKGCRKEAVIQDMTAVKEAYHKNNGKLYEHMVLSITPNYQSIPDSVYMEIGRRIAEHHTGFQCVYALHKDTCFRHLHFLYNTVSYKDGKKFSQGPPDLNKIKMYCNHVLEEFNLDPIRSNPLNMIDTGQYYFNNGWRFLEIDDDYPDDRDMFLAPPPQNENSNQYAEDCEYGRLDAYSAWYSNDISGGYNNMKSQFNYPVPTSQDLPSITQSATMAVNSCDNSGNGLNLVNVNNITLNSLDDLGQATSEMNSAFNNAARAGAEAMAILQQHGSNANVTVTTINNFSFNSDINPVSSIYAPYEEKD